MPTETVPNDVKSIINLYREWDLEALSNVVVTSQNEQMALEAVFREKFLNGKFIIKAEKNSTKISLSSETGKVFEEHDIDVLLNCLKNLGHLISSLKVDYEGLDTSQRSALNQQLSESCAKSLLEIKLIHSDENDFVDLSGPFVKVETVQMRYGNLKRYTARFDKIFPSVNQLDLNTMHYVHPGFVEHHFVHLKNLIVEFMDKGDISTIEKRLKLNPQLQNVSLYQCNWNILKMMSKTMQNLEQCELKGFNDFSTYEGDDIHFENLKIFRFRKFSAMVKKIPKIPLVFGNLEEIACSKPMHLWLDIIFQNKNLKIVRTGEINEQQLFQIAEELPNLEEFATGYNTYDSTNKVVRFIEKGKCLKRVAFWQSNFNSRNAIVEQLGNEWRIAEEGGRFVFIKN